MKYFLDTEFLEGTQNKNFLGFIYGKTKSTIDLISIGIVSEDGREYYAISKDFNLKEAWNRFDLIDNTDNVGYRIGCESRIKKVYWIKENVLKPIYNELATFHINYTNYGVHTHFGHVCADSRFLTFTYKNLKWLINKYGKTNKQISEEIKDFVYSKEDVLYNHEDCKTNHIGEVRSNIQFYGYYSDYDWVVFCWLFGKMIDLPKGFPMYCIDLEQMMDEVIKRPVIGGPIFGYRNITDLKNDSNYPKQTNEHNALADAKWNYKLYKFLNKL